MLEIVLTNKNEIMTTATVQTTNIILYTVVPPNTAAHFQVPNKGFLSYIYDSQYRRFPNTAAFSSVPRPAVLGGTTAYYNKAGKL